MGAVPYGTKRVKGRPDIQNRVVVLVDLLSVIVVDHIAHLCSAAVHDPVMAVEWQTVPHEVSEACSGSEFFCLAAEPDEAGPTGAFILVESLPFENLLPGLLIVLVVDL